MKQPYWIFFVLTVVVSLYVVMMNRARLESNRSELMSGSNKTEDLLTCQIIMNVFWWGNMSSADDCIRSPNKL